jgi:hypothetical protein
MIDGRYAVLLGVLAAAFAAVPCQAETQPYAGLETRAVKSLSDKQIADLRAGRGMGLALAAELNGYPGPSHVLENADALSLSAEQRARVSNLLQAMKDETIPLGEELIAHEARLDDLFAQRAAAPETLDAATAAIGKAQGSLRAAHLRYHIAMIDVLTPQQIGRYQVLRGYANASPQAPAHHH